MSQVSRFYPEIHDKDGEFRRHAYNWLASDWKAVKWTIRDPINPDFENPDVINFNCIVGPGQTLLDYPDLLEDIRKSIVIAVELHNSLYDRELSFKARSVSGITQFAYHLMRIYREIIELGVRSPSELDSELVCELLQKLAKPEHISRKYATKLEHYLDGVPLSEIPTRIHYDNRALSGVNQQEISLAAGITGIRTCRTSLALVKSINREMQNHYPGIKFNTELSKREFDPDETSEKQVKDLYRTLYSLHQQSISVDDLAYPLKIDPFGELGPSTAADKVLSTVIVRESMGRTPDIPIPVFLQLLDAATRWVIHYADGLFELERLMRENSDHNKHQNRMIRELSARSEHIGKVSSPFPLGFFRQHQNNEQESKYSAEFLAEFRGYLDQGLSQKEIRRRTGLSKPQCDYIRRIITDYYLQNIQHTGISLNYALYGFLPFCCQLILLCFTAGRESSINDLRAGCIRYVAGLRYINLYIPKTVRGYEDLPTCALVERAVNVMERLSEDSRVIGKHDKLFQFNDLKRDFKVRTMRFENVASRFMDFAGIGRDEAGKQWELNEHQFRRAFAIMYFYRYGGDHEVQFSALMHFLRHDDWTMTSTYLTQREMGAAFRQIEEEWLAGLLLKGQPNDPELRSLSDLSEDVQASAYKTKLVRSQEAKRALEKVQSDSLTVELLNFGAVCLGLSPGRAKSAKCAIRDNGEYLVAFHKASESFCEGCPNLVRCQSLVSQNLPPSGTLTDLACSSPILDSVIASGGLNEQG